MRFRETGSIDLDAPRERVMEAVARRMASEPGVRVATGERVDRAHGRAVATFIVREERGVTRLIHARAEDATAAGRRREDVRRSVAAELEAIRRLVEAR